MPQPLLTEKELAHLRWLCARTHGAHIADVKLRRVEEVDAVTEVTFAYRAHRCRWCQTIHRLPRCAGGHLALYGKAGCDLGFSLWMN